MTISIESRIDSVRLHRTGAVVTRRASVPAGATREEVRLSGLPLSLDDSTVRVLPAVGVTLSQLRIGIDLVEPAAGGEPVDEQALRALERDEASLRAELAAIGRARMAIDKAALPRRPPRSDGATPPADIGSRRAFLRLRAERLRALFADEHKLSEELARVVKRRAAMAEALARTQGDRPPEAMSLRKTAAIDLLRSQDGPFDIEVSYFVPAALWAPSYALRIDAKTSRAVIELRAAICQATGEDWSGVAVSFSTAEAMRFHELEELTSLRIGRAQAPRRKSFRALDDPRELFADFDSAFASARAAVEVSVAAEDALDEVTASGYGAFPPSAGDSLREEGTMEQPRMQTMAGALPMPASFAPPPQAMAMAPPMAAPGMAFQPMPAARSRRASLEADVLPPRKGGLGLFGGGGRAGAPPVDDFEEPSEPEIELDGRLFAFESLRMPPPEAKKGRLALATPMEAYLEASRSLSRVRAPAIAGALEALGRARDRLLATDPPRRHVLPHAESGFHHVLMGEHRVDVPSDAAFHTLPVSRGEAPLAIRHVAVPRETSDVFRVATFQNPFAVPLLRGPCDVYVDDDFLLTVELPTVLASAEARVGLGVDQAIKLARNTHFSEQTQGLMGGALLLKHRIDIEVVSHLTLSASLEIRERVPSAHEKDEDIRIEVGEVSPPWQRWDPPPNEPVVRGAFAWHVEVEPRKPVRLSASYTIRIPSKLELVGGNRRD